MSKIHVFIVGSKGIPAQYGGFETFVEKLTAGKKTQDICYHVSCMNNDEKHFEYNGANCFNVRVPFPGALGRIFHVGLVLRYVEKFVKYHKEEKIIVYILGCRIGPLLIPHSKVLHKHGVKIYCNPDGLEWKRNKWNGLVKRFLKYCEKCLVLNCDLVICDSMIIEKYIKETYANRNLRTTYIAYGADVSKSSCSEGIFEEWCNRFNIESSNYYLIVGRFVPENNLEYIISEFMRSKTNKDLVIISNVAHDKFYYSLHEKTGFDCDKRIKFVGTVYNQELLKKIREEAFAYIHGHEVGGTNPSLLEALASTKLNMLLNVEFNREVGKDSSIYWEKNVGDLERLIEVVDSFSKEKIKEYDDLSRNRVEQYYSWKLICERYEREFCL